MRNFVTTPFGTLFGDTSERGILYHEKIAQAAENRSIAAEDAARNRRLDHDALILAALLRLEQSPGALGTVSREARDAWIASYATFGARRPIAAADVRGLLEEIRAGLSPLVR